MLEPQGDAEFWPLSGKPFFYVVISRAHLAKRFQLLIPHKLSEKLPAARVPTTIICHGKTWDLDYMGDQVTKRFQNQSWGGFATDNKLGTGDACVFELMEGGSSSSRIKFRVQILRNKFPAELMENAEGYNMNNPINID
ncbi:B3 domain-containing protein Os04g0386900-like [Cynara cardunculus var. scolymus]|nr:B3 domain-containing protein Os04g0386900-like [Cynara cardunculus var. scolymus]